MSLRLDMQDKKGGITHSQENEQRKIVPKLQIKLFRPSNYAHLQEEVNGYLEKLSQDNKKIVDISYNSFLNDRGGEYSTVMVIYED